MRAVVLPLPSPALMTSTLRANDRSAMYGSGETLSGVRLSRTSLSTASTASPLSCVRHRNVGCDRLEPVHLHHPSQSLCSRTPTRVDAVTPMGRSTRNTMSDSGSWLQARWGSESAVYVYTSLCRVALCSHDVVRCVVSLTVGPHTLTEVWQRESAANRAAAGKLVATVWAARSKQTKWYPAMQS